MRRNSYQEPSVVDAATGHEVEEIVLVSVELEVQLLFALFEARHHVVLKFVLTSHLLESRALLCLSLLAELLRVAWAVHRHALGLEYWQILLLNPLRVVIVELALVFRIVVHEVLAALSFLAHKDNLRSIDDVLVQHLLVLPVGLLKCLCQLRVHLLVDLLLQFQVALFQFVVQLLVRLRLIRLNLLYGLYGLRRGLGGLWLEHLLARLEVVDLLLFLHVVRLLFLRVSPEDGLVLLDTCWVQNLSLILSSLSVVLISLLRLLLVLVGLDYEVNLLVLGSCFFLCLLVSVVHLQELGLSRARLRSSLRFNLLFQRIEQIELPLGGLLVQSWRANHVELWVREVLLWHVLRISNVLAGDVEVVRRVVGQSVLEQRKVVDAHECITLHQLCWLLRMLADHVLVVVLGCVRLLHQTNLIAVTVVLND